MLFKSPEQSQAMQEGGKILAAILRELAAAVRPGITTQSLEDLARQRIKDNNVEPSFLGYNDYPAVLCTSINEEAVHAVPSARTVKQGDLLKLDFGIVHEGLHTDSAITVFVGEATKVDQGKLEMMAVCQDALDAGIDQARAGNTLGDIGAAIQEVVESNGYTIVQELGGHGIGTQLHEAPWIGNFGEPGEGDKLVEGMAIAIEPIISAGGWRIEDGPDGHAYVTKDKSLSAHFEHTIIITKGDPIVVTK